jgi:putative heme-binding domain-containing protein
MKFTGLISTGHGPQLPIAVSYTDREHPITKTLADWTTVNEELYNNAAGRLEPTAHALARGKQGRADSIVTWTNIYEGKTRVFGTTLGHNSATVADPRYLDLVTRGLLWAVDKLDDDHLRDADNAVREDLAKGKIATASSTQSPDHAPGSAIDGNPATRWCASGPESPQWWEVDLGKPQDLTGIRIVWEQDGVWYRYKVEGSEDGKTWIMLSDQTKSNERDQDRVHDFLARAIRYIRVTATELKDGAWASIFEVEVYGTLTVPAPKKGATTTGPIRLRRAGADGLLGEVKIPPGFTATVFARPPDVRYPTCLAATPDGVLYVGVDENGSLDAKEGRGRVVRCVDVDNDGVADRFNDFAKMDSPRGIVVDGDTAYVLHPPDLTAYHDDNADGVADRSEPIVKGIGFDLKFRGADHTTNGIRLGIDGFLYIAVGDYGFLKAVGKDGTTLAMRGGGIVRVRTDGTGLEIVSRGQRNIYDVAVDPYMNLFTRDNTNDGDGWDVRLSHVVPTAQMGYPSLFKNFADEIVAPLADYGGGSPTGSLHLEEPGIPAPFGGSLYTCEWGREAVFRHPLDPSGAGFKAGQEPFVTLPRPTDIDVDGRSRIFIASWRGASFTYVGPNVGYVLCVTPNPKSVPAAPNLKLATPSVLIEQLGSQSQVARLAAQREILRRGDSTGATAEKLADLARAPGPLASRVAAIFTLELLPGRRSIDLLAKFAGDPAIREFALKALADRKEDAKLIPIEPFAKGLTDQNPRVRLQSVVGLGRLGRSDAAAAIVERTADPDPLVAHVAVNALVALRAVSACLQVLRPETAAVAPGAARALQAIYEPAAVDGLIKKLEESTNAAIRHLAFRTLCRLDHREADYRGDWWTTRPDTSGPYYKPIAWSESLKIERALAEALKKADSRVAGAYWFDLIKNKVELPEAAGAKFDLVSLEPRVRGEMLELLGARKSLTEQSARLLSEAASSVKETPGVRARALRAMIKHRQRGATRILAAVGQDDNAPSELGDVWREYISDVEHGRRISEFRKLSEDGDASVRELGFAVLLSIATQPRAPERGKVEAERAIESAWKLPEQAVSLLRAIGRTDAIQYAFQVRNLLRDPQGSIRAAAESAAARLELDGNPQSTDRGPTLSTIPFDSAVAAVTSARGDARRGERLFQRQGCIACHTVAVGQPPKGPSLLGIASRYKRAELAEAILKPSAKIAQGFETQKIASVDGQTYEGFVVRESADEVELRDVRGSAVVIPKKEIDARARGDLSIMPTGLVDALSVTDFAALLAYLESLGSR